MFQNGTSTKRMTAEQILYTINGYQKELKKNLFTWKLSNDPTIAQPYNADFRFSENIREDIKIVQELNTEEARKFLSKSMTLLQKHHKTIAKAENKEEFIEKFYFYILSTSIISDTLSKSFMKNFEFFVKTFLKKDSAKAEEVKISIVEEPSLFDNL